MAGVARLFCVEKGNERVSAEREQGSEMKEKIKSFLADIVFWLYEKKIIKNHLKVMSVDETLDQLNLYHKSLVRFGDSDIVMICGRKTIVQDKAPELGRRIAEILHYDREDLLVTISDIFEDLSLYTPQSQRFWKNHLLMFRHVYEKNCNVDKVYGNTFISRMYYNFADRSKCAGWIARFREVWKEKDLVVVEGAGTHNGVGNDLLDNAGSVTRIVCPPVNAWNVYGEILKTCLEFEKDKMFLVSLGSTAKVLTADLVERGYRVIDIGNLDMEYEWFLRGAKGKEKIPKHSVIGRKANEEAGYWDYLHQIYREIDLEVGEC